RIGLQEIAHRLVLREQGFDLGSELRIRGGLGADVGGAVGQGERDRGLEDPLDLRPAFGIDHRWRSLAARARRSFMITRGRTWKESREESGERLMIVRARRG